MKPFGVAGRSEFSTISTKHVICSSVSLTGPSMGKPPGCSSTAGSATIAISSAGKQLSRSNPARSFKPAIRLGSAIVPVSIAGMMKPFGVAGKSEFSTISTKHVICPSVSFTGPSVGNPPAFISTTGSAFAGSVIGSVAGKQPSRSSPARSFKPAIRPGSVRVPDSIAGMIKPLGVAAMSEFSTRSTRHVICSSVSLTGPSVGKPPGEPALAASIPPSSGTSGRLGFTFEPSPN